jgi:hypothetical protein
LIDISFSENSWNSVVVIGNAVSLLNKTAFLLDELRIIVASVSDARFWSMELYLASYVLFGGVHKFFNYVVFNHYKSCTFMAGAYL